MMFKFSIKFNLQMIKIKLGIWVRYQYLFFDFFFTGKYILILLLLLFKLFALQWNKTTKFSLSVYCDLLYVDL